MPNTYNKIKNKTLQSVAEAMCVSARTAPKARGIDNLVITILSQTQIKKVITEMNSIAKKMNKPSCKRDANNIKNVKHIVVIGTKKKPLGLNCGYCGYNSCSDLSKTKGVCAYNSMDLGIALGSACSVASNFNVDNRLMYSIGKASINCGFLGKNIAQAIGIPMDATGKNIFFDR